MADLRGGAPDLHKPVRDARRRRGAEDGGGSRNGRVALSLDGLGEASPELKKSPLRRSGDRYWRSQPHQGHGRGFSRSLLGTERPASLEYPDGSSRGAKIYIGGQSIEIQEPFD